MTMKTGSCYAITTRSLNIELVEQEEPELDSAAPDELTVSRWKFQRRGRTNLPATPSRHSVRETRTKNRAREQSKNKSDLLKAFPQ